MIKHSRKEPESVQVIYSTKDVFITQMLQALQWAIDL